MMRFGPICGAVSRIATVVVALCLASTHVAAQPLNPPIASTNNVSQTNIAPPQLAGASSDTNFSLPTQQQRYDFIMATARYQANTHDWREAEENYIKLLDDGVPESMQKTALFELAGVVRSENDLPRAQAVYTQYLQRWPGDTRTPEIYLHQGQLFREMGLPALALTKFYGVMTTALALKNSQVGYYKGLVLRAQVEIAETHYLAGEFKDAVDYYSRLLTQNDPALDREQIQFRLIRSLEALGRHAEASREAQDFLDRFPNAPEEPEVRYHLAQAYKGMNRNTEALQQVKIFLQEEHGRTTNDPAVWAYWQQRVGNEIGNDLYQEGDYVKALQVYLALTQLDPAPTWQLPVRYQIGLTYEKLQQPRLAIEAYENITNSIPDLGTNISPNLKSVVDMARWRLNFLEWNRQAEAFNHGAIASTSTNLNLNRP